jgi:hypothetical protein
MKPPDVPPPSLSASSRLAAICERFEAAWSEGESPQLEDFLEQGSGVERPALLRELIRLDIRQRGRRGESPSYDRYRLRFPEASDWIDSLAAESTRDAGDLAEPPTPAASPAAEPGTGPASATEPLLPALGPHELRGEIGSGGMGVVYRAWDLLLGRMVALKMLRGSLLSSPGSVQRFCREAQAAARVRHPHLLPVISIGLFQGQPCFTMPYLPGDTLAHRVKQPWTPRQAAALLEKVARGVAAAHAEGIVHRDLKPSNILFDDQGEPLVADFGLAKFFSEQGVEITVPGQVMGTPAYMSPEQVCAAHDRVGPASDVWSLGVILYLLLTGQRPFPGEQRDEVFERIRNHSPRPPSQIRRDVPPELESLVLVCLDKDPARRYPTAAELADDLARWLCGEPIRARPAGWRRHRRAITRAALAAVLLAGLLGGVWWFSLRNGGPTETDSGDKVVQPLGASEVIELTRDNGLTRSPTVLVGAADVTTVAPGVVEVQAPKLALVQLLDRIEWPRFRFRGEVMDEGNPSAAVGLYVTHTSRNRGAEVEHWFIPLSFCDEGVLPPVAPGKPKRPRSSLELYRFVQPPGRQPGQGDRYQHSFGEQPLSVTRGVWRPLCLEVTPETIRARLGPGKAVLGTIIRGREWRQTVRMLGSLPLFAPNTPPEISWQGGLGLFCHAGKARFRRLVVEPLAASD